MLFEMQHAPDGDYARVFIPDEIDAVEKTARGCETVCAKAFAKELRRTGQLRELCFHGLKKRESKPLAALLIPVESGANIRFRIWGYVGSAPHGLRRMRALTSSHEEPSAGFAP